MCGIWAQVSTEQIDPQELSSIVERLYHRGPDGHGRFYSPSVALVHTRLSIIDLNGGAQPLESSDGRWVGVVNGEIYNYRELRNELEAQGVSFQSQSDSEVLLLGFAKEGKKTLERVRGEFAFIFYDRKESKVYFGRDPSGVKPLYIQKEKEGIRLASEVKAMIKPGHGLNENYFKSYFCRLITIGQTLFEGIEHVIPGRIYTYSESNQKLDWEYYCRLPLGQKRDLSGVDAIDQLDQSLRQAVKRRLVSDVEVGCYLSGGLDSSLILAMMCSLGVKPKAFTVGFGKSHLDESQKAKNVAEFLGVKHYMVELNEDNFLSSLEKSVLSFESPISNMHGAAKNLLSELARKHVKVVLSGEGADEWLGGYAYHRIEKLNRFLERHPGFDSSRIKKLFTEKEGNINFGILDGESDSFGKWIRQHFEGDIPLILRRIEKEKTAKFLFGRDIGSNISDSLSKIRRLMEEEGMSTVSHLDRDLWMGARMDLLHYILANLGDRQEMSHSLEGRTPYLDLEVLNVSSRLSPSSLIRGLNEKWALRQVAKKYLPVQTVREPKFPFFAPESLLGTKKSQEYLNDYINVAEKKCESLPWNRIRILLRTADESGRDKDPDILRMKLFLSSTGLILSKLGEQTLSEPKIEEYLSHEGKVLQKN